MRCRCCDKELSDKEVVWNNELNEYEFCTTCLDIALEAAYGSNTDSEGADDRYVVQDNDFVHTADVKLGEWLTVEGNDDERD